MDFLPRTTALIVVDVQQAFDDSKWGERNNPHAEENIAKLLQKWRETNRPIFHIQHVSDQESSLFRLGSPTSNFKKEVQPLEGEPIIQKYVNSAFIGTDLEKRLRDMHYDTLVITGLTTNHCVETTTRMAGNLGFRTFLVSDATATFDRVGPDGKLYKAEDIHHMSLVSLHEEFAEIISTEKILKAAI